MRVRELAADDFPDLCENYFQCYAERDAGTPIGIVLFRERPTMEAEAAWFARLRESVANGGTIALVAEDGGHAVGLCTITRSGPSADSETGHVGDLGVLVRRGFRGRGIGSTLLREALDRSRDRFEVVTLSVLDDNVGARRLYERLGFVSTGSIPRGMRRGGRYQDVVQMALVRGPGRAG